MNGCLFKNREAKAAKGGNGLHILFATLQRQWASYLTPLPLPPLGYGIGNINLLLLSNFRRIKTCLRIGFLADRVSDVHILTFIKCEINAITHADADIRVS